MDTFSASLLLAYITTTLKVSVIASFFSTPVCKFDLMLNNYFKPISITQARRQVGHNICRAAAVT